MEFFVSDLSFVISGSIFAFALFWYTNLILKGQGKLFPLVMKFSGVGMLLYSVHLLGDEPTGVIFKKVAIFAATVVVELIVLALAKKNLMR